MGYYTRYTLKVISGDESLVEKACKISDSASFAINDRGQGREATSWYDHEKDLKKFSRKHPETVFELSGEGEESGDVWKKYFQAGKVQETQAKITFEPFDPSKLQ